MSALSKNSARAPRFLVVKIGALGDIFFALPALKVLKQHFPDCEIDWIVGASFSQILKSHQQIQNVIVADPEILYRGSVWARLKEVRRIRKNLCRNYDAVFVLHRSFAYLPVIWRLGPIFLMSRNLKSNLLTWLGVHSVFCKSLETHEAVAIASVFEHAGRYLQGKKVGPSDIEALKMKIRADQRPPRLNHVRILGIHIGGGSNQGKDFSVKQWPHFGALIQLLLKRTNWQIHCFGGPTDVSEWKNIETFLGQDALSMRIQNQIGQLTFEELPNSIQECDLFVGPDSGLLHIADWLGVPAIGLYGPTSRISWGLLESQSRTLCLDLSCSPCYRDDGRFPACPYEKKCMRELRPEVVLQELISLDERNSIQPQSHLHSK